MEQDARQAVVVARADRADVDGIVALARLNEAEAGGTLTGRRTPEAVATALARLPNIVARRHGRIVGFLLTADKSAPDLPPVVRAMIAAYPGDTDAYIYGPICVAASERGGGVMAAMVAELKRLLPGREGILFIRRDNAASLRAHAKLGMREVAGFVHDGADFAVFAYR
ncbi:MAG: N-acetyltransferase family protein [Candidatus Eiseniibacteriota bacterium]